MGIRLSHTAKDKYLRCPLSYHMHYNLGFREAHISSPLIFGSAVDEGLNTLLLTRDLGKAEKAFLKHWSHQDQLGKKVDLARAKNVKYSKADLDESLLPEKMDENIAPQWYSMREKGLILIRAYADEILPKIKKVHEVQKFFSLPNENGDQIIGFLDLLCEWEDGRTLIMDNKTSSKKYPDDKIETEGGQLALYKEAFGDKYNIDGVGYIVMEKGIRKKEPRHRIQVMTGEVPEDLTEKTFDEFEQVLYGIRMGQFHSNHPVCNTFFGDCICNSYYPSGGKDLTGLVQVTKGKK